MSLNLPPVEDIKDSTKQSQLPQPSQLPQNTNVPAAGQVNSIPVQNNNKQTPQTRVYPPRQTFYTGSSALMIELTRDNKGILLHCAPALAQRKYDWNNKIVVKMGIDELDIVISLFRSYFNGINAFNNLTQFFGTKKPGTYQFYHQSPKGGNAVVSIGIGKRGIPMISFYKTEANGQKRQCYFPVLPTNINTIIRTMDQYCNIVVTSPTVVKTEAKNGQR